VAHGEARVGTEVLGSCLVPIVWSGFVELYEEPRMDGWSLRFQVVDSNIYDEEHEKRLLAGGLWDRIKGSVQPRFEAIAIDLGKPFDELRGFLRLVTPPDRAFEVDQAIATLVPVGAMVTPSGAVRIDATVDVALAAPTPVTPVPEPPLSDAELEAFTARADQWDAFLTFAIQSIGRTTGRREVRDRLLETLLEARHGILDALATPSRREDPVRRLFVDAWKDLAPISAEVAADLPGAGALGLLTFVAAGDALAALDAAGPAFGIEVSADGLRRMARLLAPESTADPLEYTDLLDPGLRMLFGFGPPLEVETPAVTRWLAPGLAWAAEVDHTADWKGWLFASGDEVNAYLARVHRVLLAAADQVSARENLGGTTAELYRRLVPAAAWQESCWRQFVRDGARTTYIRSSQGSVGMMQVNERVWRGFYETERLRWKIDYNARAGGEILLRYVRLVAGKQGEPMPQAMSETARAIYATYNGGPGQPRIYLDAKRRGKALTRVIDKLFGPKFDTRAEEMTAGVARCLAGG
jgi:hypothetical protein